MLGAGILQKAKSLPGVEPTYRLLNAPRYYGGQVLGGPVDAMERGLYRGLTRDIYPQVDARTKQAMRQMQVIPDGTPEGAEMARMANADNAQMLINANYEALSRQAARQAAIVPGALRFAGSTLTNPGLIAGAGAIGGTLGIGSMIEDQAQRQQLAAMGISPEDADLLSAEITAELIAQQEAAMRAQQRGEQPLGEM